MTVSWRCTFLLRFLPLEILRFQCRKMRLNLPSPLCPLSPNPFSQLKKKNNQGVYNRAWRTILSPFSIYFCWPNEILTLDFPSWKTLFLWLLWFQPVAHHSAPSLPAHPSVNMNFVIWCSMGVIQSPAGGEGVKNLWCQSMTNYPGVMGSWWEVVILVLCHLVHTQKNEGVT